MKLTKKHFKLLASQFASIRPLPYTIEYNKWIEAIEHCEAMCKQSNPKFNVWLFEQACTVLLDSEGYKSAFMY